MSDIINLLPDSVANQIAAGEVIDRPASAVKELLENAIDAGATRVELIVRDAGRTLIRVVDNGSGMSENDARLCFERHATSKIRRADDLFAIRTMGFRGEALASIAAVAQVELKTRQEGQELGTLIEVEGSDVKSQMPCQCEKGTSMAVKNLFFNIPARRNFLKKDTIEMAHIEEIFRRVALVNPTVAFAFYGNDRTLYDLRAGNFAQRIVSLFGEHYRERLFPVDEASDVVTVTGFVCRPEFTRKRRGEQYVFCNERFIKHSGISGAVESAYQDLIPERTFPSYFLALRVDPSRIDVNIHPTKTEVRFIDEHAILAIVHAATKKALGQFSLASEIDFDPGEALTFRPLPKGETPRQPQVTVDASYSPFRSGDAPRATTLAPDAPPQQVRLIDADFDTQTLSAPATDSGILGFAGRYIVTTLPSGLIVIDQQRAWERIVYDGLMRRMQMSAAQAGAQQLLFPVTCTLSAADAEIASELLPDLRQLGFEIEPLGATAFVVSATPPDVGDGQLQEMLANMVADYKASMMQRFNERAKSLCLALARQMAKDKCKPLQQQEMQGLIAALFACGTPNLSPEGKKTLIVATADDMRLKMQ